MPNPTQLPGASSIRTSLAQWIEVMRDPGLRMLTVNIDAATSAQMLTRNHLLVVTTATMADLAEAGRIDLLWERILSKRERLTLYGLSPDMETTLELRKKEKGSE